MDETWLYHYDQEAKQQSMKWRHSDSPRLKNSEFKNPLEKFSPRFFRIKTASSSSIIFQRAKLSTWSITYLCWCNWRKFWRKNPAEKSPSFSCSCMTITRITGHLEPRRKWPTRVSIILITHPIHQICPRRTTTCLMDLKNNSMFTIFFSDAEVIATAQTWLDGQTPDFF